MRQGLRSTRAALAAATALLAGSFVVAPQAAWADASSPQSAADCRAIADFNQRGACWDALDKANQQGEQAVRKRTFGLSKRPTASSAPKRAKAQKAHKATESEGVDELTLTIASVSSTPTGRLLVTSTDGAVWAQTDSDPVTNPPAAGGTVHVTKGSLGGYLCQVTRWQRVRCERER